MNKFDFVCLLETFVEDLKTNVFYNFIHFVSPAVRLSRAGRRSGVASYFSLKKSLADYVQEISLGVENIITMKLSRRLFGISADVFLICVYSAPLKSPLYSKSNFNNGISAGRTPLHLQAKVSSIRFWLRLMRMEAGRLPRKAYNMLANVHNNGRQCWVSAVHRNLMMYGFGYVWANQGVQNVNWFLRVFRERITDCWRQRWDDRIHERDRYSVYRIFKLEHSLEPYFYCVTNKALSDVFIRFRLGISEIKTHKLRYSTDPSDDLSCPLCKCCVDFVCVSVVWMTKSIFCLYAKPQKL